MSKLDKDNSDMNKVDISRRNMIAGSTCAVLASLAIAQLGSEKALVVEKRTSLRNDEMNPIDQPDGLADYEQFKSSGLL